MHCYSVSNKGHQQCSLSLVVKYGIINLSPGHDTKPDWLTDWPAEYQLIIRHGLYRIFLTHWGRDKMAAIIQTTFSSAFSWIKMYEFRLRFHWIFVPKGSINNIPSLVQIMAWRRPGDKPLSEPMMVSLLTHICVTRPQWLKLQLDCRGCFSIRLF